MSPHRFVSTALHKSLKQLQAKYIEYILHVNFECILANQMHAFKTKILGTLWPLFCFLNAFSKALIWHKAEKYIYMSSSNVSDKEKEFLLEFSI